MKDDQKDQNSINQSQEHRAVPSVESQATSELKAAPSCEHCSPAFISVACSLHSAAPALYAELVKARDTFNDFIIPLRIMRRGLMADACEIARDSMNAALALATTQDNQHARFERYSLARHGKGVLSLAHLKDLEMEINKTLCPVCEELQELCHHCGYCKGCCTSDESQRDFDSEMALQDVQELVIGR